MPINIPTLCIHTCRIGKRGVRLKGMEFKG